MGGKRLVLSAGHNPWSVGARGTNSQASEHTLAAQVCWYVAGMLYGTGVTVLPVPEAALRNTIHWTNAHTAGDPRGTTLALDVHFDACALPGASGVSAFHFPGGVHPNLGRIAAVRLSGALSLGLLVQNRGAKPDHRSQYGALAWVRNVRVPSVVLECGFITSSRDASKVYASPIQRHRLAECIVDGVRDTFAAWDKVLGVEDRV